MNYVDTKRLGTPSAGRRTLRTRQRQGDRRGYWKRCGWDLRACALCRSRRWCRHLCICNCIWRMAVEPSFVLSDERQLPRVLELLEQPL